MPHAISPKQKKEFGIFNLLLLLLQQFFNYLSRKAEGYGPVKPWQPLQLTQL